MPYSLLKLRGQELYIYWKEVKDVTAVICTQNEQGLVIASDTWNTTQEDNKYIRKIAFNKDNKIIIAQAGVNSVSFPNQGKESKILDLMQKHCDNFSSENPDKCYKSFQNETKDFIDDIRVVPDSPEAGEEIIYIYYSDGRIVVNRFIYSRWWDFDYKRPRGALLVDPVMAPEYRYNSDCFSIGLNHEQFNNLHIFDNYNNIELDSLLELTQDYVYDQKYLEAQKSIEEKHIGGPVEWIVMDKEGHITTNME